MVRQQEEVNSTMNVLGQSSPCLPGKKSTIKLNLFLCRIKLQKKKNKQPYNRFIIKEKMLDYK
jgi:hypothetical protein